MKKIFETLQKALEPYEVVVLNCVVKYPPDGPIEVSEIEFRSQPFISFTHSIEGDPIDPLRY